MFSLIMTTIAVYIIT